VASDAVVSSGAALAAGVAHLAIPVVLVASAQSALGVLALIAAWAVEAQEVFIYMRDEYPAVLKILQTEIPKLEAAGLAKHTKVSVRRGAGAYICGEETGLIESLEGKRAYPRIKPP